MYRIQLILIAFLIFLLPQITWCQTNQSIQYLQKVGALDSLHSERLKEYRHFYVQLPASYNSSNSEKYPVVFILDGEVLLPTVNNVQNFYSGGFMPEMVLVGISNAHHRTRDLTTSKIKEMYGMPYNEENGEADNFYNFIDKELIPYIEDNYPVTNFRTLIGHSYGGLFAIYTLLNHPQSFSNYIAIDPSLDWDNQKLLSQAQEKLSEKSYEDKSLFVSLSGQLHMQDPLITIDNVMEDDSDFTLFPRSNISFSNVVKQNDSNGLDFKWKFYPRDIHGTIPFPSIMDGLIFDFDWYQMENTDKFNSPSTSKKELYSIINYRRDKLNKHFNYTVPPYPEDLLNALGYMSMDMDQMEKAKMFFEFAIEFYPNSPNTYDSMADYYERNNDHGNAIILLTKAYEINENDFFHQRIIELKKKIKN